MSPVHSAESPEPAVPGEPGILVALVALPAGILALVGLLIPISDLWRWAGDLYLYQQWAQAFLGGGLPYRDFPFAYPPLALLPMALPQLLIGTDAEMDAYRWLYLFQHILFSTGIAASVSLLAFRQWTSRHPPAVLVGFAVPLTGLATFVAWRYDVFVSFLVVLAVVAVAHRRPGWSGVALGIGAMAKVFPAYLLPVILVWYLARRETGPALRVLLGFVVVVAICLGPFVVLAGPEAFSFVRYQLDRGLEIESLLSGLILLAHLLFGVEVTSYFAFNSWNIASPLVDLLTGPLQAVSVGLLAAVVAAAYWSFRRGLGSSPTVVSERLSAYLLIAALVVILTNKVLSPQYLVWLLPLVAVLPMRLPFLLAIAGFLSIVIFPLNWEGLIAFDPWMIVVLNLRNLILVAMVAWLLWRYVPLRLPRRPVSGAAQLPARTTG